MGAMIHLFCLLCFPHKFTLLHYTVYTFFNVLAYPFTAGMLWLLIISLFLLFKNYFPMAFLN